MIWACIVLLIMMLMFTALAEYLRLQTIAKGVRDGLQSSVISVVNTNWDNNFNGLRQGYSGGYVLDEDDWEIDIENGAVYYDLSNLLGLHRSGSEYIKYTGNEEEYKLYDLYVDIINVPFKGNANDEFSVDVYITLEASLSFGWGHLPDMIIPLKVKAKYIPKF